MSKKESLSETAARWFIRLQHLPSEAPEHSQFEAWLAASPAHQAEYASISELWQQLDSPEDLRDINARMQQKAFLDKATRKKRLKNILASTGACITIGLAALLGLQQYQVWQAQPVLQMASHNPVGQISTQTLEDGSKVTLSAQSDIQVTFYRHQRHIKLNRGEAIFEVTKDADRPFVVETGTAKITVLGTRFAVNKLSKLVRVSVDHGRVQIESTSLEGAPVLVLQAGQVAEILPQRAPARMTRNAEDAFGFAQGRLVFDKADLDELAETLSRYHATPLVATGNSPARVTAVININNSGQFIQSLPDIAPVQVVSQPGQTIIRGNK